MLGELRAVTAPAALDRASCELRTYPIAPVLPPSSSYRRQKATTSASSSTPSIFSGRDRQSSIAAIRSNASTPISPSSTHSADGSMDILGPHALESIAFDPFSSSKSFRVLLQSPEVSRKRREDPILVRHFRRWMLEQFPRVIQSFRELDLVSSKSLEPFDVQNCNGVSTSQSVNQNKSEEENDIGDLGEDDDEDGEAWRVLFRHARVISAAPDEMFATQSTTPAEHVDFLLNGFCEVSFQPKLPVPVSKSYSGSRTLLQTSMPHVKLQSLLSGGFFGLDAAAFAFDSSLVSVTARGARQRNPLGLRESACTYVLRLPFSIMQQLQLQRKRSEHLARLPAAFPYSFAPEAETFLSGTFLFRAMTIPARRFLAAHLRSVTITRSEYLFTPGQPVTVFLIASGQFTLGAPREESGAGRDKRETAELELELLQTHDAVGLMETYRMEPFFSRYCVTTSTGARAYTLATNVLLMVLAQEPAAATLIREWVARRQAWFELRRATALAQHKKSTGGAGDELDGEQIVRLTLTTQRRSKLACSRCGWAGHVSTSASCVFTGTSTTASVKSLLNDKQRDLPTTRTATRIQVLGSRSSRRSQFRVPVVSAGGSSLGQMMEAAPESVPKRKIMHHSLQIDSVALGALLPPEEPKATASRARFRSSLIAFDEVKLREEERSLLLPEVAVPREGTPKKSQSRRENKLSQSFQRLEAALAQDNEASVDL